MSFLSRRVLVTGASGFLGLAIARALVEAGASVRALARDTLPGELIELGVEAIRGDLHDVAALDRGLQAVELVFHVAADVRSGRSAWAAAYRANVEGTGILLDRSRRAGVHRFIYTSTGSTIGKPLDATSGDVVLVDESSAYDFAEQSWTYPHTKWLAEQLVLEAATSNFEVVLTHPTSIFGPGDQKLNVLPLFKAPRSLLGWLATGGVRTTCDVRDVAQGHLSAALRGRSGERYAMGGEILSVRSLLAMIAGAVGGHAPRVVLPARAARALGRGMEAIATLRGRAPLFTEEMAILSSLRVAVSSAKAERELGYRSRPAVESIRDMADYYRRIGAL